MRRTTEIIRFAYAYGRPCTLTWDSEHRVFQMQGSRSGDVIHPGIKGLPETWEAYLVNADRAERAWRSQEAIPYEVDDAVTEPRILGGQ